MKDSKASKLLSPESIEPKGEVSKPLPEWILTANELSQKEYSDDIFLWGNHIVKGRINAIIGGSDLGKSTLIRLLATAVAQKKDDFLTLPIRGVSNKVLIVSLEDGEREVGKFYQDFRPEFEGEPFMENIHFCFEHDKASLKTIRKLNSMFNYDAIFIDSYSEVFKGHSSNDQVETRAFIKPFNTLGKATNAAFVFLHHLNKRAKEHQVSKKDILGSSGFEQIARSVLILSKVKDRRRSLKIGKGNFVTSAVKKKEVIFDFNEETLDFDFVELREAKPKSNTDNKKQFNEQIAFAASYKEKFPGTSLRDLEKLVKSKFGSSPAHGTIGDHLKKLGIKT